MGDDIVEAAQLGPERQDVRRQDADVAQAEILDEAPAVGRLPVGALHAHALARGVVPGDRNEVAAAGAAELQHTARPGVRRLQAEQPTEDGEMRRVAVRVRNAAVRQLVVGIDHPPEFTGVGEPRFLG